MKLADAHQEQNIAKPPKGERRKAWVPERVMLVLIVENRGAMKKME
jgi:hypothetical protein